MTQIHGGPMAGKTVLVTGGTAGIGRATAMGLAMMGAHLGITGRDRGRTEEAAAEIRAASGGQVDVFVADLSSQSEVRRLAEQVLQACPRIDVLVNNAALCRDRTILKMTDDEWDSVLRIDLSGTFFMIQECAKLMVKQKEGAIINIASIVGVRG